MRILKELLSPKHPECCRLVTLTGMGGTGKTRLALEATSALVEAAQAPNANPIEVFSGGIWLVPLAEIDHGAMLEKAVATALTPHAGISAPPSADGDGHFWEQIVGTLNQTLPSGQPKPVLLALDNFEQLVDGGSDWLVRLMQAVPGLSCLVTSRQRLDIAGEHEIPLTPLPVPDVAQLTAGDKKLDVDAYPGVRLFVDRARGVRPDFVLNERNTASIAELCARLDGLPLALELAAAWARLLTPAQMVDRLNARFDLLVAAHRDISPRHRSLRAVLDETTRLMPDELRQVFAALSLFRGGWTLTAAEAILAPAIGKTDMLEMMALLQQRSLVFVVERTEEARFYLLETVREYAATLLSEEEAAPIRQAHAVYFADFARAAAPHLNRVEGDFWSNRLEEERDNLRAALGVETSDYDADTLPLAAALWRYWYVRGPAEEGLEALQTYLERQKRALPASAAQAVHRAQAYEGAGRLALALGQATSACELFQEGLETIQAAPDNEGKSRIGTLATNLALAAQASGDSDAAATAYEIVLQEKQKQNDLWGTAFALSELGMAYQQIGMPEKAETALRHACKLHTLLGDKERALEDGAALTVIEGQGGKVLNKDTRFVSPGDTIAGSYLTLGHVAVEQEDFTAALPLLEEARRGFLAGGDGAAITLTYERIALAALGAGDITRARHALEEARARREGDAIDKSAEDSESAELRVKHRAWLQSLLRQAQTPAINR